MENFIFCLVWNEKRVPLISECIHWNKIVNVERLISTKEKVTDALQHHIKYLASFHQIVFSRLSQEMLLTKMLNIIV